MVNAKEPVMRKTLATAALLLGVLAIPSIAPAQTVGVAPLAPDYVTVDEARDIAAMNGIVAITQLEVDDGHWNVKGRDRSGRRVEMEIDQRTGEIAQLERFD
jgi:hypothetical protein